MGCVTFSICVEGNNSNMDATLRVTTQHKGHLAQFNANGFSSQSDVEAYVARTPRYMKLRIWKHSLNGTPVWNVTCTIELYANGTTGELNETGLKRLRKIVAVYEPTLLEDMTNTINADELDALLSAS